MTADAQLLAAAFLDGDRALDAWASWRSSVDIDLLDSPRQDLLPQLYRNLSALGVEDPILERLRSPYRHTWVANQLLLQRTAPAIAALGHESVDGCLIGDAALALTVYADAGARKIALPDVSVPVRTRRRALRTLRAGGWSGVGSRIRRRLRPLIHGRQLLTDGGGQRIQVSWTSPAITHPGGDPRCVVAVHGRRLRVSSVPTQLVRACRAADSGAHPDIRSLADALATMRAASDADWEAVARIARRSNLPEVPRITGYLRREVGAQVPGGVPI